MSQSPQSTPLAIVTTPGEPGQPAVPSLAGGGDGRHATAIAAVVHACHEQTIDQALEQLAVPGLDRDSLDGVLTYCAERRCEADQAVCPGCRRHTQANGLHTLEDFVARHRRISIAGGAVTLNGQGQDDLAFASLADLEVQWAGEQLWY